MSNIADGLLHRGFGVFLFDSQNRFLLQRRSSEKHAFPSVWSNSCCSHPLDIDNERGTTLETAIIGVRKAAQRKLRHELGVHVELDEIRFLTRVHYKAETEGMWGEHESE